jgi:hypothetical protein
MIAARAAAVVSLRVTFGYAARITAAVDHVGQVAEWVFGRHEIRIAPVP